MKNLRRKFNRFCFQHRDKGIPNLMLYICLGNAIVYLLTMFSQDLTLYYLLSFSRELILQGQVWRLITYPLTLLDSNILLMMISLFCYYSLGNAIEQVWGTLRFNLFYFSGILLMDAFCMIFGGNASVSYLNLSLLLAFATMYPNTRFLLFFIIPIKAWVLALVYLLITFFGVFTFPITVLNLYPLVALGNYFLFFGKDVVNVIPMSWQVNARKLFKGKKNKTAYAQKPTVIPFRTAAPKQAEAYTHRCTVCGRTDVSDPQLEFRYCSKCQGYHCYCEDHISNHAHID